MGRTGGMKPMLEQLSDVYISIRPALVTGRRIKRG
jgi:hypothetical protein